MELRSGASRVVDLEARAPLAAKIVQSPAGPELVLIGAAAGLLEGDRCTVRLTLGEGTRLTVRSTAATLAHPCPRGGCTAADIRVVLAPGARLAWLPEPLVACAGCSHAARSFLELSPGAAAVWYEACTLGRSGERAGRVDVRLDATLAGAPLLRDAIGVGVGSGYGALPDVAASPAVLGGLRHAGSVHLLGRRLPDVVPGVMGLAGPGATARAVADSANTLRQALASPLASFLNALQPETPPSSVDLLEPGEEKEALVHG